MKDKEAQSATILEALDHLDEIRQGLFSDSNAPVGTIVAHAGVFNDSPNQVWRPCLGQSVLRKDYPSLFLVIQTAWGEGDEQGKTFNIPNLQGMFLRGVSRGSAADPNRDRRSSSLEGIQVRHGGNSGDTVGSLQGYATGRPRTAAFVTGNESNSHTHPASASGGSAQGGPNTFGDGDERGVNGTVGISVQPNSQGHSHEIDGGGDDETRPVNAYVNYLIRVK